MDRPIEGEWRTFNFGTIEDGEGGTVTLRLDTTPVNTRWVRIWMTQSSDTCDTHGVEDRRNCAGYAIREVYLGTIGKDDASFKDLLRHSADQLQSHTYCSSVDPWHQASDLLIAPDRMESGDQPGLDLFFLSGITRGLPAVIPVAILYSTPEDAAAEVAYLEKRQYPISQIEIGEEPDGQYMLPEDYGALYLQWATVLHRIDPKLKLGGPVFQGVTEDIKVWPDAAGKNSWLVRFLDYLRSHERLDDLAFMSFEHYPYDACETPWQALFQEPHLVTHIMQVWKEDGLPPNVPMFNTETNSHGGDSAVDIFGALWLADSFAGFLSAGGKAAFYYHALPWSPPHPNCANSWGTYHMFMVNKNYEIVQPTSQYFAAELITQEWAQPADADHRLFQATSDLRDQGGNDVVTAYALLRPDGQWSLMVINKDFEHPYQVSIKLNGIEGHHSFAGPVTTITFGKLQYQWHPGGRDGYAKPDGPPFKSTVNADFGTKYTLPPASLNVIRGKLEVR